MIVLDLIENICKYDNLGVRIQMGGGRGADRIAIQTGKHPYLKDS